MDSEKGLYVCHPMNNVLFEMLRCPVSRSVLRMEVIERRPKTYDGHPEDIVWTAILFSKSGFFFPVIDGIPRLIVEAYDDYRDFFLQQLPDYVQRKADIEKRYSKFIKQVKARNASTKASFSQEWDLYNYDGDKTWTLDAEALLGQFLKETGETTESLQGKLVLDAGCGNGHLDSKIAKEGIRVVGMDFSRSVERAFENNSNRNAVFLQADVQFPPFPFHYFDVVHSSGVLVHTEKAELAFSCLEPCVKEGGKISIWSYHPRKDRIHNTINFIRGYTSRLPIRFQYYLYASTLLPVSYVIKKMKGNPQNGREMMIEILDWFSPRFRWEHEVSEISTWFSKRNFGNIEVTDTNLWGFNIIGVKRKR